ncbi:hypothetical protein [Phenylobacterium sp. SCN 70-31]|uniref:hypothetical protein n=1 Tax=Phenylobacterium sp. SCN 70-31 TaxID=1660129 RepID=UPI00086EB68A|nr:hypothetical protein [Phenylobacterium sp. SCN 70-31]ODT86131.1 MAG: hypothetical protein ABS78_17515 [Phenylobacterium sp. SCN 70-31]
MTGAPSHENPSHALAGPIAQAAPAGLLILAAALSVTGCDQPKPRNPPSAAAGPPAAPTPTPPTPDWAKPLLGQALQAAFPKTGACKGNTDIVQRTYAGDPAGVQIHGWGWDAARKARVERVVLTDAEGRIVGAGAGGGERPDVPVALAEVTDGHTGWNADAPVTHGPLLAYGVVADDTACVLGRIDF